MKFITSINEIIRDFLRKESRFDGRFLILAILLVYFGVIFASSMSGNYPDLWRKLGVPAMKSPLGDLSAVLAEFDRIRSGDNAFPANSHHTFVGYPLIWRTLGGFGIGNKDLLPAGVLLIILFYAATFLLIGRLNYREGIFYSLVLCSPPVMLLVERCNVDILMYSLLVMALLFIKKQKLLGVRIIGYLVILLTAFFKLFPVFGLSVIIKERRKYCILIGSIVFGLFLIYFFSHLEEMNSIRDYFLAKGDWFSFGRTNIFYRINAFQTDPRLVHSKKRVLFILLIILSLVFVGKYLVGLWQRVKHRLGQHKFESPLDSLSNGEYIDAFRLGAGIYIGNFLIIGKVFDTKFIFLIFAMPQILSWIKGSAQMSRSSSFALIGILVTLYISQFQAWGIDEIINWWLLGYFVCAFLRSLPEGLIYSMNNALPLKEYSKREERLI